MARRFMKVILPLKKDNPILFLISSHIGDFATEKEFEECKAFKNGISIIVLKN